MLGTQEIITLLAVAAVVFLLSKRKAGQAGQRRAPAPSKMSGIMRLAIAASVIYLAATAAWLQPWRTSAWPYVYFGAGPVAVAWLARWVFLGFRKK